MSLVAWFPLNNSITNLGEFNESSPISNVSFSNTYSKTAPYSASFNGSSNYINQNIPLSENMSFACWIRFNGTSGYHIIDCRASSGETGTQPMYGGINYGIQCYSSAGGSYTWSAATCGFTTGVWYHLIITYTPTNATLYINGESKGTQSGTFGYNFGIRQMRIGTRCTGANWFNGNLQDVRVYNYVLSKEEIKNLARGLILHYDFENSYVPIEYISTDGSQYIDTGVNGNNVNLSIKCTYKCNTTSSTTQQAIFSARTSSSSGISYWTDGYCHFGNSSAKISGVSAIGKHDVILSKNGLWYDGSKLSFTAGSSMANTNLLIGRISGDNRTFKGNIYSFIVYNGDTLVRDMIPVFRCSDGTLGMYDKVTNSFYTNSGTGTFGAPDTMTSGYIQDCSGNSLHGTLSNITFTNSSDLGTTATTFNEGNIFTLLQATIYDQPFSFDQISVLMRIKCSPPTTNMYILWSPCIQMYVEAYSDNIKVQLSSTDASFHKTFAMTDVIDGNWHHIGLMIDKNEEPPYPQVSYVIDKAQGVAFSDDISGYSFCLNHFIIGGATTSSVKAYTGNIADISIYSTAISSHEAEIRNMYNQKIDKTGNFYSYGQLASSEFNLTKKTGIIKCSEIAEGGSQALITGNYTRLEYLESNGTQYINTGTIINMNTDAWEIKAQASTASQNGMMLGCWNVSNNYWWLYHYNGESTIRLYLTNSSNSQTNLSTGLSSSNLNINTFVYKNKCLYTNGTLTGNGSSNTYSVATGPTYMFACSTTSTGMQYPYTGRIYYAKLWQNGKIVKHFVPVKKSNGTLGMFDLINGVFYGNSGTGEFVAGPEIGKFNAIGCNNLYKDGGAAVAKYDLTQKRLLGEIALIINEGISNITLDYTDENGIHQTVSGDQSYQAAINYPYSWSATASTGHTISGESSGSGAFKGGLLSISPTTTLNSYTITFNKGGSNYGSWGSTSKTAYYGDVITRSDNTITCKQGSSSTTRWTNTFTNGSATGYTYSVSYSTITSPVVGAQTITATTSRTPNTYTISYTLNSGSHSGTYASSYTFSTSAQSVSLGKFTRSGYNISSVTSSVGTVSGNNTNGYTLSIPANTTGTITITVNWSSSTTYTVSWTNGTGASLFSSTSLSATTGNPSGHAYSSGQTVYVFCKLNQAVNSSYIASDWVLISGTKGAVNSIYRISWWDGGNRYNSCYMNKNWSLGVIHAKTLVAPVIAFPDNYILRIANPNSVSASLSWDYDWETSSGTEYSDGDITEMSGPSYTDVGTIDLQGAAWVYVCAQLKGATGYNDSLESEFEQ